MNPMSETSAPADKPLAEIYWDAYVAEQPYITEKFDDLDDDLKDAVKAGAYAVAAHIANPTAADFDRAAEEIAAHDTDRYAIVELMGHRTAIGAVSETTLAGRPMLAIDVMTGTGTVRQLYGPESVYGFTPVTREQAVKYAADYRYSAPPVVRELAEVTPAIEQGDPDPWRGDPIGDVDDDPGPGRGFGLDDDEEAVDDRR
jgi:hypothetical protein